MIKLGEKITSVEELEKIPGLLDTCRMTSNKEATRYWYLKNLQVYYPHTSIELAPNVKDSLPYRLWWFLREVVRFDNNSDMYGSVLGGIWGQGIYSGYCPRPHLEDLTKIEWFPDAAAAIAERPIVTSVAKFLRKMNALYSDDYIRDMDAQHRSEMSNEVEVITGLEAFRESYITGPHSCMSARFHEMPRYDGHHPVDAYSDIPGIGMAVGRDGSGRINARSVVYINPADETDKRYVRVYGDASLRSRLVRAGFKSRSLAGLSLKALPLAGFKLTDKQVTFAAPYMDGPDGHHSSSTAARQLVWCKGSDRLVIFDASMAMKLRALVRNTPGAFVETPSSSGLVSLNAVPADIGQHTCPFTGEKFNIFSDNVGEIVDVWHEGAVVGVRQSLAREYTQAVVRISNGDTQDFLVIPGSVPVFEDPNASRKFFDDAPTRKSRGFVRWAPIYEGKANEWVHGHSYSPSVQDPVIVGDLAYEYQDTMVVLSNAHNTHYGAQWDGASDKVVVRPEKLGGEAPKLTRVHSITRGKELWADSTCQLVKTDTGRTVIPGFHEVVQLVDESWVFTRHAERHEFFNQVYHMRKGAGPIELRAGMPIFDGAIAYMEPRALQVSYLFSRRSATGNDWEMRLYRHLYASANIGMPTIRNGVPTLRYHYRDYPRISEDMPGFISLMSHPDASAKDKVTVGNHVRFFRSLRKAYLEQYLEYCRNNDISPAADGAYTNLDLPGDPEIDPPVLVQTAAQEAMPVPISNITPAALQAALDGYLVASRN